MLVDCRLADLQPCGDFLERQSIPVVEQDDFTTNGRSEMADAILQRHDLVLKRLAVSRIPIIYREVAHGTLAHIMATHHIQATVAHARQQESSCLAAIETDVAVQQPGKNIVNDIPALLLVMQHHECQAVHRLIMLLEQRFDMSILVLHSLYRNAKTDLLNPFGQFFRQISNLMMQNY